MKMKEYLVETGETFPESDTARVLGEALDEDTLGKVDDSTDLKLLTYDPVQDWILQKDTMAKSRKTVRLKNGTKGPDDMVYGVGQEAAAAAGRARSSSSSRGRHLVDVG